MYTAVYAKVRVNADTHGEVIPTLVLSKDVPHVPYYLACTLMNLKHIWMRSTGILRVYLIQRSPSFFMLVMLFSSLNLEHACKYFRATYMSLALL